MRCSFLRFELLLIFMPLTIGGCLVSFNDYPLQRQDGGAAGSGDGGGSGNQGGCVATGSEACDGLDNDCVDGIDDDVCPAGCQGQAWNGRGYMLCVTQKTYATASSDCAGQGMRLVSIESEEENEWLLGTMRELAVPQGVTFIMSGSDADEEGNWKWLDGTSFWSGAANGRAVDGRYANWDDTQPNDNDDPPGEDCVTFQARNGFWNDQSCTDDEYSVMCETQ